MPKISNRSEIVTGKRRQLRLDFTVMYTQADGFHVVIPEEWVQLATLLTYAARKPLCITATGKANRKFIVTGETESAAIKNFREAALYFIDENIEERRVIMVFFNRTSGRYNSHEYNKEHPQIGALFGLTYAIEISIPGGDKQYCREVEEIVWKGFGEEPGKEIRRQYFSPWPCAIIDDTVDNRSNLENLYLNLKNTLTAIESITNKPELMNLFLSSGTLQLSQ